MNLEIKRDFCLKNHEKMNNYLNECDKQGIKADMKSSLKTNTRCSIHQLWKVDKSDHQQKVF